MKPRVKWHRFVAIVLVMVVAGCSSSESNRPVQEKQDAVRADGFTVTSGDLTFGAGPGVADEGTQVLIGSAATPLLPKSPEITAASAAFSFRFGNDQQPRSPIKVSLKIPAGETRMLAFVLRSESTGSWAGAPVTVAGDTASAEFAASGTGFFSWSDALAKDFGARVDASLAGSLPKPNCVGKTVTSGGSIVRATSSSPAVSACVSLNQGRPRLSLTDASATVWRVRPQSGLGNAQSGGAASGGSLAAGALYARIMTGKQGEAMLVPGGTATLDASGTTGRASLVSDAGLGVVVTLVNALESQLKAAVGNSLTLDARGIGECLASKVGAAGTGGLAKDVPGAVAKVSGCAAESLSRQTGAPEVAMLLAGLDASAAPELGGDLNAKVGKLTAPMVTVALQATDVPCEPDLATIRRLMDRANARIARMACTANKRWFVGNITYVNGFEKQRYVVGHRSSATAPWRLAFAIGHGGECPAFASLTNAPLGEINALMDNFCTMMVGPLLLLGNPITFDGVGSLRIGMAASEAERLGYIDSGNDCNEGYSMSLGSDRLGIGIQVTGGRVNALTVGAPFRTLSGARVGMTDAQVARIYPKSTRGVGIIGFGQMRTITSNGKRIMFNLDGENVMSIRVDTLAKPWGEGC